MDAWTETVSMTGSSAECPLSGVDHHSSTATTVTFVNGCAKDVHLFWVVPGGERIWYKTLQSGEELVQSTYVGHVWLSTDCSGSVLHTCVARPLPFTVVVHPQRMGGDGKAGTAVAEELEVQTAVNAPGGVAAAGVAEAADLCGQVTAACAHSDQEMGSFGTSSSRPSAPLPLQACDPADFTHRGVARCPGGQIEVWAFECVDAKAIAITAKTVEQMLRDADAGLCTRLVARRAMVAVIGRHQTCLDMPPHSFLKNMHTLDGRAFCDGGLRGLGGTCAVPCTSVGEENVLMLDDDPRYAEESILVHEFGHCVMNCGFDDGQRQNLAHLYRSALATGGHGNAHSYMMSNEEEYWAEMSQAWFDATVRLSLSSGVGLSARTPAGARPPVRRPPRQLQAQPLMPDCIARGWPHNVACQQVRSDVNNGIRTRGHVKDRDPCLAELLAQV